MSPETRWLLQTQVVPRLRSAIPNVVSFLGCEDAQELVQDATPMVAKLMHNANKTRKKVTPGNIAYYTIQHVKSGRRSTGSSVADVLGSGTQLKGRTRLTSLEEVAASGVENGGELFFFHDVLSADEEDPATKAARKMDWETFFRGLPERDKAIVECMIEGKSLRDAARALKLSDSTIQTSKQHLANAIVEFTGAGILRDIAQLPQWRSCISANKEKMACRYERQH